MRLALVRCPTRVAACRGRSLLLLAALAAPAARAAEVASTPAAPRPAAVALAVLGLVVLVVGWLNTRKTELLYLGLLALAAAALAASDWLAADLLPAEWLAQVLAPLVAACAVLFLMRHASLRARAFDAALAVQCAIVPASLLLAGPQRLPELAQTWQVLLALEVLIAAGVMLWRVRRRRPSPAFWTLAGLCTVMALAIVIALAQRHQWWPAWLPDAGGAWLEVVLPLAFIALAVAVMHGDVAALRAIDVDTRRLMDKRVGEAAAEAERTYAQLAELRVEQVIERERKRIAADLHDDLGAKLLTIVHTSESDRISSLAREALEEMRLSVRGLTGKPVRLADALADWRAEFVSRLGQANIGAQWQSPGEELAQTLPARAYVQTTRILREAVNNIIKHSGASRCMVASKVQDGDFMLTVQDNGGGIPMELDGKLDRGHGMASMKQRAKQLQGQCLVESGPGFGTVIRLTIPL
ncbi:MAG TPA: ATP-binding protein [Ideonella sp.]|nr:ATP-binding protein [Ideonella sp.]